jgi:hypothetical protein
VEIDVSGGLSELSRVAGIGPLEVDRWVRGFLFREMLARARLVDRYMYEL